MTESTKKTKRASATLEDQHVLRIQDCWRRSTESIIELAVACYEADQAWDVKTKHRRLAELPFSRPTFSKYVQIGGDKRLTDPGRRPALPPKMSGLYELTTFTDEEFQAFEAEGHLTPKLRRAATESWRRRRRGEGSSKPRETKLPDAFYAALKPRRQLASTETTKLDNRLVAIGEEFDVDIVYPDVKQRADVVANALKYMRREAKKIVQQEVARRKEQRGHTFKSQPALQKHAGFLSDEVTIELDADEDRILEVLTTIGREDEFDGIRNEAFRIYPQDEPAPKWMEAVEGKSPPKSALKADMDEVAEARRQTVIRKPSKSKVLAGIK